MSMPEKTLTQQAIDRVTRRVNATADEMSAVFGEIMEGRSTEAQIAGLLIGLRMKGESVDEITGAVRAMREHMVRISPTGPLFDTCGTGGDGSGTFNVSTATAFVVAGLGVKVAKHGNRSISSRCGSADVLSELGVNLELTPEQVRKAIDEVGVGFMFAPLYHPAMKFAAGPRKEIGVRSIFNILGPLSNPAGAQYQLLGVYEANLVERVAGVLRNLGTKSAMVVHGADGLDELTLTGPSTVAELRDGEIEVYTFEPQEYGFARVTLTEIRGGDAVENANHLRDVLAGKATAMTELTILNAAAALKICGRATDWSDAIGQVRRSLASGSAAAKLEALVKFSQSVPA